MGKSILHCELAQRALVWLSARCPQRGIRGCEEVILDDGYIADACAISGLTMQNEKLFTGNSRSWMKDESDDFIWVFESKVSRSDFFNTFKRDNHSSSRLNPIGNFHFVVTPKNLLRIDEVPSFWGLLEQRGAGLGIVKMPELIQTERVHLHKIAYRILRSKHESKFHMFDSVIEQFKEDQLQLDIQEQ